MRSRLYRFGQITVRKPLLWLLRVRVHGAENEPEESEGPYIICANHTVFSDPIFLCAATSKQQPHFMAKKELFRIPLLGWLIKGLGAFPIDRGGSDVSAIKKSIAMINEGKCVGIFPQGHRYVGIDPRKTEIHHGIGMIASRTRATVLPCYLCNRDYKYRLGRRLDIVIGRPMRYEEYSAGLSGTAEYSAITDKVFDRICTLGEQFMGKEERT